MGSLRIIAAAGVPILLGYLLNARNGTEVEIGFVQSAFMFGIGLGGLTCAALLRRHHERAILWLCPLLVTPVLLVLPWTSGWGLAGLASLSGLLLGISLPVLVSRGQELMPDSPRIASSITMGVSWGVGGAWCQLFFSFANTGAGLSPHLRLLRWRRWFRACCARGCRRLKSGGRSSPRPARVPSRFGWDRETQSPNYSCLAMIDSRRGLVTMVNIAGSRILAPSPNKKD